MSRNWVLKGKAGSLMCLHGGDPELSEVVLHGSSRLSTSLVIVSQLTVCLFTMVVFEMRASEIQSFMSGTYSINLLLCFLTGLLLLLSWVSSSPKSLHSPWQGLISKHHSSSGVSMERQIWINRSTWYGLSVRMTINMTKQNFKTCILLLLKVVLSFF